MEVTQSQQEEVLTLEVTGCAWSPRLAAASWVMRLPWRRNRTGSSCSKEGTDRRRPSRGAVQNEPENRPHTVAANFFASQGLAMKTWTLNQRFRTDPPAPLTT